MKRNLPSLFFSTGIEGKSAHEIPCANSDCVLSFCINEKLRQTTIKSTGNQEETKRRKDGNGFK